MAELRSAPKAKATVHRHSLKNTESEFQRNDLFHFIRSTMWFTAMYQLPLSEKLPGALSSLCSIIYCVYEIFLDFVVLHIGVLYICTIYLNIDKGDLEFLASCLIQTIIYLWAIMVKVDFRRVQQHSIHDIMVYLNVGHRVRSAPGFTYVTMAESVALQDRWVKTFLNSCFGGVIFWLCLPVFYNDRSLPLTCWYPVDYKQPFIYETLYFLQIIGQLQVAAAFSVTSTFFLSLAVAISGQYDVLNCSLKNIIATAYIKMGASKQDLIALRDQQQISNAELNQYYAAKELHTPIECLPTNTTSTESTDFNVAFKIAFKDCIEHHRFIIGAQHKLEHLYHILWFFKTGEVTFLLCLVAFVSVKSTADNSLMRMLSLGQYLVLVAWEMFIICYAGEIVTANSQRCGEAILRSPWYLHAREMKSYLLFFVLNAKRPFRLSGGKFVYLNLDRYRRVVTTAFSFLTLLQNMDMRK